MQTMELEEDDARDRECWRQVVGETAYQMGTNGHGSK